MDYRREKIRSKKHRMIDFYFFIQPVRVCNLKHCQLGQLVYAFITSKAAKSKQNKAKQNKINCAWPTVVNPTVSY